jgi:RHS repeat-associated protein
MLSYGTPAGEDNAENRVVSLIDPDGKVYQYGYGDNSTLTSVMYPDNRVKRYQYAPSPYSRALTGVIDENGNSYATYAYDDDGQASLSEHAGGAGRVQVTYVDDSDFRTGTATVVDALGTTRTYTFSNVLGVAHIATITQPAAGGTGTRSTTYGYDVNGNLSRKRDFNNVLTCYSYDLVRNLETSRTEGLSGTTCPGTAIAGVTRTITTTWHPTFRLPDTITEGSRTTDYDYDSKGSLVQKTVIDNTTGRSRVWAWTYNDYGQVLTEDGPRTDVADTTEYAYYTCMTGFQCGQLHTVTNSLGQVTTYGTYNAHGQPLTVTDPNGVVTTLTYDLRQRLKSRSVANETVVFDYWPTGLLKTVTQPDGSFLLYTYDAAHRLKEIEDRQGNRVEYVLDAMGNRTAENTYDVSGTLVRTRTQVFNALNQLWKQVGAAGTAAVTTAFGYDNNGNQTTTNAPLGRNSVNAYDELDRLKQITDAGNGITRFGYDANDNLTSVTDPRNLITGYTYNGLGDIAAQASPDTGATSNTYDSAGNLETSTDARAAVTTYTYDVLNRVKTAAFKIGTTTDQTITFSYDAGTYGKGRLTGASDASHALAWTYDALGRVTGKGQTVGSMTMSVGYGYVNGNLVTLTLPSGQLVTYGYNSNNQIISVQVGSTVVLSAAVYKPFGPISGWTWGNGTTTSRSFDADGKLADFNSAGLKTYSYDDAFRITGITDAETAANSWTYGYDLLDRLTSASKNGMALGWTYDANGNRLTQTGALPSTYTISGTSNRISSISGTQSRTYSYDAMGNTTGYTAATATYNNRGRMRSLTASSGTVSFTYNALGQRVQQSGGASGTVLYMYDEAGHVLGEYSSAGALIQETVWLGDIPVATLRPNGASVSIYYVHSDHLNTPIRVTRPSDDKLMWRWDSGPFGTDLPAENPAGGGVFVYNLRFAGQLYDAVAGLHYNYFRDYDPAAGRYVESDPIGLDGGLNTYAYVGANPISLSDPTGLVPGPWHPPGGFKFGCRWSDTCPQLKGKMWTIMKMINSHQGWDRNMPHPRGGNRHHIEIAALWNAYGKCQMIYNDKKCEECGPDKDSPPENCQSVPVAETVVVAGVAYVIWKIVKTCGCGLVAGPPGAVACAITP